MMNLQQSRRFSMTAALVICTSATLSKVGAWPSFPFSGAAKQEQQHATANSSIPVVDPYPGASSKLIPAWRKVDVLKLKKYHVAVECQNATNDGNAVNNDLYPTPKSCNKFLVCVDGQVTYMDCPKGLQYHAKTQVCDRPSSVNCVDPVPADNSDFAVPASNNTVVEQLQSSVPLAINNSSSTVVVNVTNNSTSNRLTQLMQQQKLQRVKRAGHYVTTHAPITTTTHAPTTTTATTHAPTTTSYATTVSSTTAVSTTPVHSSTQSTSTVASSTTPSSTELPTTHTSSTTVASTTTTTQATTTTAPVTTSTVSPSSTGSPTSASTSIATSPTTQSTTQLTTPSASTTTTPSTTTQALTTQSSTTQATTVAITTAAPTSTSQSTTQSSTATSSSTTPSSTPGSTSASTTIASTTASQGTTTSIPTTTASTTAGHSSSESTTASSATTSEATTTTTTTSSTSTGHSTSTASPSSTSSQSTPSSSTASPSTSTGTLSSTESTTSPTNTTPHPTSPTTAKTTTPKPYPSPRCQSGNSPGLFPVPGDCTSYFNCSDHEIKKDKCPALQQFDGETLSCKPASECSCHTPTIPDVPLICPKKDAFYADTRDCGAFWRCLNHVSDRYVCPVGKYWDSASHTCKPDDAGHTHCPSGIEHPPGSVRHMCRHPNGLFPFSDTELSQYYVHCSYGYPFIKVCPADLFWDNDIQGCNCHSNIHPLYGLESLPGKESKEEEVHPEGSNDAPHNGEGSAPHIPADHESKHAQLPSKERAVVIVVNR